VKKKKADEVEVIPLGKQPVLEKIHGAVDKDGKPCHSFKAKLEEQFEYRAKDSRALIGMAKKTIEKRSEQEAKLEREFGYDRIANPQGEIERRRLDEIAEVRASDPRWGQSRTRPTMMVPALPWQRDRRPGERYDDYMRRKASH